MPRTKGSKNNPKAMTADFASQITEKQETIASLKTEAEAVLKKLLASGMSADEILEKLK